MHSCSAVTKSTVCGHQTSVTLSAPVKGTTDGPQGAGRRSSWSVTANSRLWSTQDRNTRQRRHLILWSCVHCRVRRQLLVPSDQQTRVSSPVRSPELICDWVAIEDAANAASLTTRHSAFRATYAIKAIMTHSTCLTSWLVDPLRKRNLWYWLSTQRRWCLHR